MSEHYATKFGQTVIPIAILKSLAVISSSFKQNSKLWIVNVAPSRHLKSQTSLEQKHIFPSGKIVYAGSDFTIHSINRDYEGGRKLNNKCLAINDLTLLLASKVTRTSHRLIDALSELFSEGRYIYGDWQKRFEIKARFSLIANITPHSYRMNRHNLLGNTFLERCLVVFHRLTPEEMKAANLERDRRTMLKPQRFRQTVQENDVLVTKRDLERFNDVAERWQIAGGYSSSSQTFDMVKSIAVAYAILSDHRKMTRAEFLFLDVLEPYVSPLVMEITGLESKN